MRGGLDDDYMEGNQGIDTIRGEAGQDDLIGGRSASGTPDEYDVIFGGALADVVVGDNGAITRPGGVDGEDSSRIARAVTLFDVGADPTIGGNDVIFGGAGQATVLAILLLAVDEQAQALLEGELGMTR